MITVMLRSHLLKTFLKLYFHRKTYKDISLIFKDYLKLLSKYQLFRNFYSCIVKAIALKINKININLRISVMTNSFNPLLILALII